ncbi:hypothetical protein P3L10_004077 [Capsicum annuum]
MGSASWTSICWFTCSTSCVFYPVWSNNKGIKLAWGYNISCRDNPCRRSFCCRYFGHCISYAVVASVLLGAAVSRYLSVTNPLESRQDALQSTVIRLREGFRREDQNSSASSSEGCGSSVKRSSSADAGHLGNATVPCTGDGSTWNNIEGINSDKSIDSGRPSLALRSSSCRSVVQEPEVGSSYVERNLEHNSSLVVCSSSGLESQDGDSSTSTSANQQILDLNLALAFQEKLSDPRITSMLKRKGRHTDRELANLLQDKGLDPNFAVMLKENGLDPMILALLQRSSLDADREHRDSNPPVTDSNDVEDVLPNHISFLEELRLQGLGKWLQRCRVMLHHVAGTPERAWLLFSLIFILETVVVAIFRPKTIKLLNATHQQFEFGIAVLLLSPVVCSILVFLRSLQAGDLSMTSKPRKYVKSSVLLGLSLTVPLMVACLSIAIPIWIRNGYQFWSSRAKNAGRAGNHLTLGMKELSIYVCRVYPPKMRYSIHGQRRGYSAGGCQDYDTWHQNPQYRLRASGPDASLPIHLFITLTEGVSFSRTTAGFRNYQSIHDSMMFCIGMRILKTRGRRAAYNIYLHESVGGKDYVNSREISCEMVLDPDPKGYTIVPTTIHPVWSSLMGPKHLPKGILHGLSPIIHTCMRDG